MGVQNQFSHLEKHENELDKQSQLEVIPEEAKALIVEIFEATPKNLRDEYNEIEPLSIDEM